MSLRCVKVYLSEEMLSAVNACASDQSRSRSNLIQHAVKGYLSRYKYWTGEKVSKPGKNAMHVHAKASEGNSEGILE
jgi:metal-responsive CopG/Arc/MetJ family transcriptional regulator